MNLETDEALFLLLNKIGDLDNDFVRDVLDLPINKIDKKNLRRLTMDYITVHGRQIKHNQRHGKVPSPIS
jgi:hypothetical protein